MNATRQDLPRLYHDLADLWPLVNPPEDCRAEAALIQQMLEQHWSEDQPETRRSLLELGVGAGSTMVHLIDAFDMTGVDLSEALLTRSRALNPTAKHHLGDIRDVRLGRTFDAVLAHDVLDYMLSAADLRAAVVTAAEHLDVGGLFLAATNYTSETFIEHELAHDFHQDEQIELTSVSYVHAHQSGQGIELVVLLLIRKDGVLRIETDRQHCGLFKLANWRKVLNEGGFDIIDEQVSDAGTWFVASRR